MSKILGDDPFAGRKAGKPSRKGAAPTAKRSPAPAKRSAAPADKKSTAPPKARAAPARQRKKPPGAPEAAPAGLSSAPVDVPPDPVEALSTPPRAATAAPDLSSARAEDSSADMKPATAAPDLSSARAEDSSADMKPSVHHGQDPPTALDASAREALVAAPPTALVPRDPPPPPVPLPRRHKALSPMARRLRALAMRGRSDSVDEFGLDLRAVERCARVLDALYERYFRVETTGIDHVPDHGRALLVANRAGTLPWDALMLGRALVREHPLRRPLRPLLDDDAFHAPFLGVLMSRLGAVRACHENAGRLLAREQLVGVFPEGQKGSGKPFSERYHLQRFGRGGFVKLALRTAAPLIPVAIVGSEEAQPLLGKLPWLGRPLGLPHLPLTPTFPWLGPLGLLPLPSKWRIAVGEPLHLHTAHGPEAADDQALVGRLAEQVRQRIQEMLTGLLQQRRSVLWG